MELPYPINLVDFEDDATEGDVVTRYGAFLGRWKVGGTDDAEVECLEFVAHGETAVMFAETYRIDIGMLRGMALSAFCGAIRDWHEAGEAS